MEMEIKQNEDGKQNKWRLIYSKYPFLHVKKNFMAASYGHHLTNSRLQSHEKEIIYY